MRFLFLVISMIVFGNIQAQGVFRTDTIQITNSLKTFNTGIYSDSLSSSFYIVVPAEVKLHKHEHHTEQVVILSGEAEMNLEGKVYFIKAGDVIFIPSNTPHSVKVTSKEPLKLISIQAPYFDGKDRVMLDQKQ